jgi:hypothetical protein
MTDVKRARTTQTPMVPNGAVGFITVRPDQPERLALYRPGGELSNTFAADETLETLGASFARHALRIDAAGLVWPAAT